MLNKKSATRGRTFLGGKIIFNSGRSVIDCIVREMSDAGASATVESAVGIPPQFKLVLSGDNVPRACVVSTQSGNRIEMKFEPSNVDGGEHVRASGQTEAPLELVRAQTLALRSSLDDVEFGVVLLDTELRATFINRAFRKMWHLPDAKADAKPPFVALMYHGRDTQAYLLPAWSLDKYIAERVARIKVGNPEPLDLRLSDGEVLRMQCAVLPNGGRMLCYTHVTDIVRNADELEVLKTALYRTQEGILLLDADLHVQFMNAFVRRLWNVSDDQAESKPHYSELVGDARHTGAYGVKPEELDGFIAQRIAFVRAGDPTPQDLRTGDGRHIRSQCTILPSGGRMLTYCDITDLIRNAEKLEELATTDSLTALYNRRHFMVLADSEWSRFQRYQRPLSLLMVDIDYFKRINDGYGHAVGDAALSQIAKVCAAGKRQSDIVGRLGGDEFALLLPETDMEQATIVAERVRHSVAILSALPLQAVSGGLSVSIGVAAATLSMSGVDALLKGADQALYEAKLLGRNRVASFKAHYRLESNLAAE
jgi:diguanylate cyclase (GGDEF)-like protein